LRLPSRVLLPFRHIAPGHIPTPDRGRLFKAPAMRLCVVVVAFVAVFAQRAQWRRGEPENLDFIDWQSEYKEVLDAIGRKISCLNCKQSFTRFVFEVSRHINAKMTPEEKEEILNERLAKSHPCADKQFPADLIVARNGGAWGPVMYSTYSEATNDGGKKRRTAIFKMGKDVRRNASIACHFFIDGNVKAILAAMVAKVKGRMGDINFRHMMCLDPSLICSERELPGMDDPEDFEEEELKREEEEAKKALGDEKYTIPARRGKDMMDL